MSTPLVIFLVGVNLAILVGLAMWETPRCVACGRKCGGRIAGGTIDSPLCPECAR